MVLLVLLGLTVTVGPQDEGAAIVTWLAFGFLLVSLAIIGPPLRACYARTPGE